MSDADDPAQRYLALWTQYLTALLADPRAMETLKRWASFTQQFSYPAPGSAQRNEVPFPVWPPFFGPFAVPPASPSDADPLAGRVAALAQRVDELERRLAALEPLPKTRKAHKRGRR
jgi:hypothetical protein